jgi:choline kinase
MEPVLLIMAAGMGSRYGGNKQLDPVTAEGDIIMDFSLYDAYRAGFRKAVFVIKREMEDVFREHLEQRAGRFFDTRCVFQELTDIPAGFSVPEGRVKPWGTGHAVYAARDVVDAPFAVINADDYYGAEAFRMIYDFLSEKAGPSRHCMVGFRIENTLSENGTVSRGICREENGVLTGIEEHLEVGRDKSGEYAGKITGIGADGIRRVIDEKDPVSMNFWGFGREFMGSVEKRFEQELGSIIEKDPLKGEFYLPFCIDSDIREKKCTVEVLRSDDRWFGVTYSDDKAYVMEKFREMKERGKYPHDLWK